MLLPIRDAEHAFSQGDCARAEAISTQIVRSDPRNAAAWHLLGLARKKLGRAEAALEALAKAAKHDRRVPRYHHDLGNALVDDGKLDRAISAFRQALRIDDRLAEVHNDLGAAYFQKGWHAEAEACFRKAIERDPAHAVAHGNLGAALRAQGKLTAGRRAYQRALYLKLRRIWPFAIRRSPAAPPPQLKSGEEDHAAALAHEQKRSYEAALRCVRQGIEKRADVSEYHITHARLLLRAGEHEAALQAANIALKLEPGSAAVHASVSALFHQWRDDLAEQAARHALELDPELHLAHANLAAALWGQGRLEEAERAAREAVRLNAAESGFRSNLALILKDLGRIDEARAVYRELAAAAPNDGKVCLDIGALALETEGDLATARRLYRAAQAADIPRPSAYMAEALVDLLEGRYAEAWPNYEARKNLGDQRLHHRRFAAFTPWQGQPVRPGELLVYGEQGLGDEVMFASMYAEVERHAAGSRVLCDPRLAALFSRSFPALEVIGEPRETQQARATGLAGVRFAVAAGSLGQFYRRRAEDFPRHAGYLRADPQKTAAWKEKLGPGRKAGLSWMGGAQKTGRIRRSLSLGQLKPLLELPGVEWISLQHGFSGAPFREFANVTADADELAALVSALDLVVSVCNTTVHMAGALGRDVLVMAPFVPEWRYGIAGDMRWYPSARLFRQRRYGEWSDVLGEVAKAVKLGA